MTTFAVSFCEPRILPSSASYARVSSSMLSVVRSVGVGWRTSAAIASAASLLPGIANGAIAISSCTSGRGSSPATAASVAGGGRLVAATSRGAL